MCVKDTGHSRVCSKSDTFSYPQWGVKPTTLGLLDPRSNQLSYEGYTFDTHGCDLYLLHTSVTLPLSNLPSHPPTQPTNQPTTQPTCVTLWMCLCRGIGIG